MIPVHVHPDVDQQAINAHWHANSVAGTLLIAPERKAYAVERIRSRTQAKVRREANYRVVFWLASFGGWAERGTFAIDAAAGAAFIVP